jgi:hypothetical protein
METITAEMLAGIAGAILSLCFSYIPGLNKRWDGFQAEVKRLVMFGLLVMVACVSYLLACVGWAADVGLGVTCDRQGIVALAMALLYALMANQSTYQISKR